MVIVDALDEAATGFYTAHGFVRLPDSLRLVLPMRLVGGSLSNEHCEGITGARGAKSTAVRVSGKRVRGRR